MFLKYFLCLAFVRFSWASEQNGDTGGVVSERTDLTNELVVIYNGVYDNSQQAKGNSGHAYIQLINRPLLFTNISPRTVWYTEWAVNGTVVLAQISTISEINSNVYFHLRNVSDALGGRFQEFDIQEFANYTDADLGPFVHGCIAVFRRLAKAVYSGYWAECSFALNNNFINYVDTATCKTVSSVIPPSLPELFNVEPYFFQRINNSRFPLPENIPDTYEKLCAPKKVPVPECQ